MQHVSKAAILQAFYVRVKAAIHVPSVLYHALLSIDRGGEQEKVGFSRWREPREIGKRGRKREYKINYGMREVQTPCPPT